MIGTVGRESPSVMILHHPARPTYMSISFSHKGYISHSFSVHFTYVVHIAPFLLPHNYFQKVHRLIDRLVMYLPISIYTGAMSQKKSKQIVITKRNVETNFTPSTSRFVVYPLSLTSDSAALSGQVSIPTFN